MYKILPILLFAFLNAEESMMYFPAEGWEMSNRLQVFYAEREIAYTPYINDMNNLLNPEKFLIKGGFIIVDTIRIENIFSDSVQSKIEIIENNYLKQRGIELDDIFLFYRLSDDSDYYEIRITRLIVEVNVDNSIQIDNHIRDMVWETAKRIGVEKERYSNFLLFNSVDISKLIHNNNQLSLNRDDIYDDSWAVIIGIDKYKYSKQLNYAVKDAEAVKNMLVDKFDYPEENIRYLIDEEATLSNIKLNLGEVATLAGEDDRILVFYSGHGETLKGADGSETGYIIPYEGRQDNPYATGLVMDEILRTCQISKSKHMLFLMDACYSGLMTENFKGLSKPKEEGYLSKVANEKARQIITAGGRDEQVIERDEWQHSAFTKNLLEGLDTWEADYNKDGCITADELSTYLRENVTEDSDFQQTPQDGRFRNSGGGEFVFFSDVTDTISSSNINENNEDAIIYGCMDKVAINYNPDATNPDRSCKYRKLINNLEFGQYKWEKTDANKKIIEVPLLINNMEEVVGLQFDIIGGKVINILGGITEDKGFEINTNGNTIVTYATEKKKYTSQPTNVSAGGGILSGGNQVLFILQIEPNNTEICIQDIIVADLNGNALNSISLDCIRPKIP